MLNLILPQSLRCPADPYFTQVATHYPHLHRQGKDGLVHYGHFEDTPTEVQDERIHRDMRNNPHYCSGYRDREAFAARECHEVTCISLLGCRYERRNLAETNSEAEPPIPMALTVLEMVQYLTNPRGYVNAMLTMVGSEARDSRVDWSVGSAEISQPDTTQVGDPALYTSAPMVTYAPNLHLWYLDPLPLCLALTYNAQISYFYLSLNQHLPPSNHHTVTAAHFEWSGKLVGSPPVPMTISFGRNCLLLVTEHSRTAEFRYPTAADTFLGARGFRLRPVSGSHFFARPSHGLGHKHPIKSSPEPSTPTSTYNSTMATFLPRYLPSGLAWVWVPSPPNIPVGQRSRTLPTGHWLPTLARMSLSLLT